MKGQRLFRLLCGAALLGAPIGATSQQGAAPPQQGTPARPTTEAEARGAIGDAERSAITFLAYDLAVQLRPESSGISVLARVTVRNDGQQPLPQVPLQISSSLHWESASETVNGRSEKVGFSQHLVQTDADHTGEASEVLLGLLHPLEPNASADLTLLYTGEIRRSTARLARGGVSSSAAEASEWDSISPERTMLRGFGDVLWYPVASQQVFLGEGASVLEAAGQQVARQRGATVRLRVAVEYTGEPPVDVYFLGRREPLVRLNDDADAPVATGSGVATAEFGSQELGFRTPSLLVTDTPATAAGPALAVVSGDPQAGERLQAAAAPILQMLSEWVGDREVHPLTVIDQPGAPFADGSTLVVPVSGTAEAASLLPALVTSLTRARFQSRQVWLDQGVPQLMLLLAVERTQGRAAAVAALEEQAHGLALAESLTSNASTGAPTGAAERSLLRSTEAVFFRTKAAAVLWMLRDLVGDEVLKAVLQRYAHDGRLDRDEHGFERLVTESSGKDLHWFFEDWVNHDRGLPELSIVSAAPRELPAKTVQGAGWLVAVEVRNDGAAAAEVPVTVRSGTLTATERLRVGAHSSASTRVLFQGVPEQVQVNDGTVPELLSSRHVRELAVGR